MGAIKEKYDEMKRSIKLTNQEWGWGQKYSYNIHIHTQRGKNELIKLLNSDRKLSALDYKLGVIDEITFNKETKIFEDCERSINNIEIW